MRKLKEINYLDRLCFRIPANWIEHFSDDEGGMYFQDVPGSGTLRLSTLVYEVETKESIEKLLEYLRSSSANENVIEDAKDLGDGTCLIRFIEDAYEDGIAIRLHWWKFVNHSIGDFFQVAMFSLGRPPKNRQPIYYEASCLHLNSFSTNSGVL